MNLLLFGISLGTSSATMASASAAIQPATQQQRPQLFIDPRMVAATAQPKVAPPPALPQHLKAVRLRVGPHDLNGYRILNAKTGSVFFVHYDEAGRVAAERSIPVIDEMLSEVARLALVDPATVHWGSVSFARASAHDTNASSEIRWHMQVDEKGALTAEGEEHFFNTLPHEQVHAAQKSQQSQLPRWFAEGHASWVGLKVTKRLRPQLAEAWRTRALAAAKEQGPLDLTSWGGVRITGAAIQRQLTPEEQARMAQDPGKIPNRSFHFNAGETVSDESQTRARYGAALALFEALEAKHGLAKVNKWVSAAWSNPVAPHWTVMAELAKQHLGQDITPDLKAAGRF
jgi:hypothetical protein